MRAGLRIRHRGADLRLELVDLTVHQTHLCVQAGVVTLEKFLQQLFGDRDLQPIELERNDLSVVPSVEHHGIDRQKTGQPAVIKHDVFFERKIEDKETACLRILEPAGEGGIAELALDVVPAGKLCQPHQLLPTCLASVFFGTRRCSGSPFLLGLLPIRPVRILIRTLSQFRKIIDAFLLDDTGKAIFSDLKPFINARRDEIDAHGTPDMNGVFCDVVIHGVPAGSLPVERRALFHVPPAQHPDEIEELILLKPLPCPFRIEFFVRFHTGGKFIRIDGILRLILQVFSDLFVRIENIVQDIGVPVLRFPCFFVEPGDTFFEPTGQRAVLLLDRVDRIIPNTDADPVIPRFCL